jgi:hypothetical protein
MTDLTDFLLARIAEDEAVALRARDNAGSFGVGGHMVAWTPGRVLAECEAKRRIIERVSEVKWTGSYAVRDVVLEILALPYADHPDYRPEWRP